MPKGKNQKLKILYLKKILCEETSEAHPLTLNEITEKLSAYGITAERKSLYSDIEALREYGIDIVGKKEKNFSYFVASRHFELPELKLLADAVSSSKFITKKKSAALIKKLESLANRHDAASIQRQVYVSNRIKTPNESIYYNVDTLHAAISADKMVSFKYFEYILDYTESEKRRAQYRKEGSLYFVSPIGLCWDDENYYLIAFDCESDMIKHYRVDKMSDVTVTDKERDGKKHFENFDPAIYTRRVFGMFGGEEETVRIKFANRLIGVVLDRFGSDSFISRFDDDHFCLTAKVHISPQFFSWLFAFGDEATVLSPQSLRDTLKEKAENTAKQYSVV